MEYIEIEVINWELYNPRADRKKHSWFRLENSIATEPKFHKLSAAKRFIAICLFAEVSKNQGKQTKIIVPWLADQLKVKPKEIVETIEHLTSLGVVRLPLGNQAVSTGITTYERTNDTNERTSIAQSGDFADFWSGVPRKVGKGKAAKAYWKLIKSGVSHQDLCRSRDNYKSFCQKNGTEARFIKHGSTFLNEYLDWLDPETGQSENFSEASSQPNWAKIFNEPGGVA